MAGTWANVQLFSGSGVFCELGFNYALESLKVVAAVKLRLRNLLTESRLSARELLDCVRSTQQANRPVPRTLSLSELEERVMLSASPVAVVLPVESSITEDAAPLVVALDAAQSELSAEVVASEAAGLAISDTHAEEIVVEDAAAPDEQFLATYRQDAAWMNPATGEEFESGAAELTFFGSESDDEASGGAIIFGAGGNDKLTTRGDSTLVLGGDGNDIINGSSGDHIYSGGGGADLIDDSRGDDVFILGGNDIVDGGWGTDTFLFGDSKAGDVIIIDGSNDDDTIDLSEFGADNVEIMTSSVIEVTVDDGSFKILHYSVESIIVGVDDGNTAPQADSGVDQTVVAGEVVTLSADGSLDLEGESLTYQWTQVQGPWVALENASAATTTFTAPELTSDLKFVVVVSDGNTSDVSTVTVTVDGVLVEQPVTDETSEEAISPDDESTVAEEALPYLTHGIEYQALEYLSGGDAFTQIQYQLTGFHVDGGTEQLVKLPPGMTQVAFDEARQKGYGLAAGGLYEFTMGETTATLLAAPESLSLSGFQRGIAFDVANDRVVFTTLLGAGKMYSYSPADQTWAVVSSLGNVDLMALTYDSSTDSILGFAPYGDAAGLYQFDDSGAVVKRTEVQGMPDDLFFLELNVQLSTTEDHIVITTQKGANMFSEPSAVVESQAFALDRVSEELSAVPDLEQLIGHEHVETGVSFDALSFEFDAAGEVLAAQYIRYGADGLSDTLHDVPANIRQMSVAADSDAAYGITTDDEIVTWQLGELTATAITLDAELPADSEFNGISAGADSLLISTNAGEGFLYRYTYADQQWAVVTSQHGLNFAAITASYNGVTALSVHDTGATMMYHLGFDGYVSFKPTSRFASVDLGGVDGNTNSRSQLVAVVKGYAENFVIVTPPMVDGQGDPQGQQAFTYDTSSGNLSEAFGLDKWHDAASEADLYSHPEFTAITTYVDVDGNSKQALTEFLSDGTQRRLFDVPAGIDQVAYDESSRTMYGVNHSHGSRQVIEFRPGQTEGAGLAVGGNGAFAFDTLRGRLITSDHYGAGNIYAYDPECQHTTTLGTTVNADVFGMTYHAGSDSIFGMATSYHDGSLKLYQFDGNGLNVAIHSLDGVPGAAALYGWNGYQLTSAGDYVVLIKGDTVFEFHVPSGQLQRGPVYTAAAVSKPAIQVTAAATVDSDLDLGPLQQTVESSSPGNDDNWIVDYQSLLINGYGGDDIIQSGHNTTLFGGAGNDILAGGGVVDGGSGNDIIITGSLADVVYGGDGNNSLETNNGNDVVFGGGNGDESISTGRGSDVIFTGGGNDTIDTSSGSDRVVVTGAVAGDVIQIDGGSGSDTIDLSRFSNNDVRVVDDGTIEVDVLGGFFTVVHEDVERIVTYEDQLAESITIDVQLDADGRIVLNAEAGTALSETSYVWVQIAGPRVDGFYSTDPSATFLPQALSSQQMVFGVFVTNSGIMEFETVTVTTSVDVAELDARYLVSEFEGTEHDCPHEAVAPESTEEPPEEPVDLSETQLRADFTALRFGSGDTGAQLVQFGADGYSEVLLDVPAGIEQALHDSQRDTYYGLSNAGQLVMISDDGGVTAVDVPESISALGKFSNLAIVDNQMLYLTADGGDGTLVAMWIEANEWVAWSSLYNIELESLGYQGGQLQGVAQHSSGTIALYRFHLNGQLSRAPERLDRIPVSQLGGDFNQLQVVNLSLYESAIIAPTGADGQQAIWTVSLQTWFPDEKPPIALSAWQDTTWQTGHVDFTVGVVESESGFEGLAMIESDGSQTVVADVGTNLLAFDEVNQTVYVLESELIREFNEAEQVYEERDIYQVVAQDLATGLETTIGTTDVGFKVMAYDSVRHRLLFSRGIGLVTLDLVDSTWATLSATGVYDAIAHDPVTDSIYGLNLNWDESILTQYDADGTELLSFKTAMLPVSTRFYGHEADTRIAVNGDFVGILLPESVALSSRIYEWNLQTSALTRGASLTALQGLPGTETELAKTEPTTTADTEPTESPAAIESPAGTLTEQAESMEVVSVAMPVAEEFEPDSSIDVEVSVGTASEVDASQFEQSLTVAVPELLPELEPDLVIQPSQTQRLATVEASSSPQDSLLEKFNSAGFAIESLFTTGPAEFSAGYSDDATDDDDELFTLADSDAAESVATMQLHLQAGDPPSPSAVVSQQHGSETNLNQDLPVEDVVPQSSVEPVELYDDEVISGDAADIEVVPASIIEAREPQDEQQQHARVESKPDTAVKTTMISQRVKTDVALKTKSEA